MIPEIQESRLPNGLTLWLVEHHSLPLVVSSVVLRAGSDCDPEGKSGLASLTAEALDAGTHTSSRAAIAERFEFVGATFRPQTYHDGSVFTLSTLAGHHQETFGVMADLLVNAVFPQDEVERLRRQRLTSLLQQKDRPATIATKVFSRHLFGRVHPYGTDAGGDEPGLEVIRRADLQAFQGDYYAPDRAIVIAVGDIAMPALLERVSGSLAGWRAKRGTPIRRSIAAVPAAGDLVIVDRPGSVQSEIRLGGFGIARNTDDYYAVAVMNRILGGQFSSRLNANLREKRGLTYGAWSTFQALRTPGPFVAGGAFHTEKTAEASSELLHELELMRDGGISDEELRFAQESLAGSFALAFETPAQIAQALSVIPLYDLPKDTFATYTDRLREVTREDVLRVARRYLDTSRMTMVIVGDAARITSTLEGLRPGPMRYASPDGELLDEAKD
ncbi:MAG: insulinase family protein [Bacteroidetes bacterium]|nr:insulinase family protein [Bacteroidota bacterium]